MKILYCNKYNFAFSGTEAYLFNLMRLMRDAGHEVGLFSMANARGTRSEFDVGLVPNVDFKDAHMGLLSKIRAAAHAIYSLDARARLRQVIRDFKPDVAHVRNIYHHLSPSILWELKSQRIPVVYHLNDFKLLCPSYNMVAHGRACERCRANRFWSIVSEDCYHGGAASALVLAGEAYLHHWLRTYERCVDLFLAPSQFVKQKLIENGWKRDSIEVLPHFQALPEPCPDPPDGAPVLYFGRLSPEKGVADLIRAMRLVPQVRLWIAGEGPQREELEQLASHLGLLNVAFLGQLEGEAMTQAIAACQFSVLPSHAYETFGKTILESYACGRPVIASDLGSRRELVHHGETGLLYPVGDVEQLAAAIAFLAARPEMAAELGAAGRKAVRQHHSPAAHYRAMVAFYERLLLRRTAHHRQVRVAFIGGRGVVSRYSGIEAWYEQVGARLVQRGNSVTAYCRPYFTPDQPSHLGIRIVRIPAVRSKHLETFLHTLLATVIASFGPYDIVHYHALGPSLFSFLPRLMGKKTVVTVQGLDWQRKKWGRAAAAVLRIGERTAVRFPDATTVVSRTLQNYYMARHHAVTNYIPNGGVVRDKCQPRKILEWGLSPENYVLFLGRFSPEKNCRLLIAAFERLEGKVQLVLAGGTSYTDSYVTELRSHASERIRFLDWKSGEELDELLTNAMIFVLPSDLEGLSLALLDAMGAAVCPLTSDIPENREAVEGVGFTFRSGDTDDLAGMLQLLISDAPMRSQSAQGSRRRVLERYSWDHVALETERLYHRLLGQKTEATLPAVAANPGTRVGR
jgi:glycosyltransferase involved in cell wall biosynthesis